MSDRIKEKRAEIQERLLMSGQDAAVFELAEIDDDYEWTLRLLEMCEQGIVVNVNT